jgi:hypothetical protein
MSLIMPLVITVENVLLLDEKNAPARDLLLASTHQTRYHDKTCMEPDAQAAHV